MVVVPTPMPVTAPVLSTDATRRLPLAYLWAVSTPPGPRMTIWVFSLTAMRGLTMETVYALVAEVT